MSDPNVWGPNTISRMLSVSERQRMKQTVLLKNSFLHFSKQCSPMMNFCSLLKSWQIRLFASCMQLGPQWNSTSSGNCRSTSFILQKLLPCSTRIFSRDAIPHPSRSLLPDRFHSDASSNAFSPTSMRYRFGTRVTRSISPCEKQSFPRVSVSHWRQLLISRMVPTGHAPSWISTFCAWQRTIFSCFTLWNVFSGIVSAPPLGRSARKRLETRSTGKHEGLHARSVVLVQFNGADLALYG